MGIPVQQLVEIKGEVNVPDCVGCGRCITNCPERVLRFSDVRSLFKKTGVTDIQVSDVEPEYIEVPIAASVGRKIDVFDSVVNSHKGGNRDVVADIEKGGVLA